VVGQYGLHFAKTGVLDPRFGRLLDRALTLRQLADYGSKPESPSPGDVRKLIDEGRSFLQAAREHLRREGGENGGSERN
jgi:uncharacterized protein (UPF0332 family)